MEGVEIDGAGAILFERLGLVAQHIKGAAEPIAGARPAQGAVSQAAKRLEMGQGLLGLIEVAQAQPARQKGSVLSGIDGEGPGSRMSS